MNGLQWIPIYRWTHLLVTAMLIASATHADGRRTDERDVADQREIPFLASMIVVASRLPNPRDTDLDAVTLTARRLPPPTPGADLGSMTVTAKRIDKVTVASQSTKRFRG